MAQSAAPMILLLGVGALALASKKKKRRRRKAAATEKVQPEPEPEPGPTPEPAPEPAREEPQVEEPLVDEAFFDEDFLEDEEPEEPEEAPSPEGMILALEDAKKKARLGGLYQIRKGDSPQRIAREALYGTRTTIQDPDKRDNVVALSILIDCAPWNQANYGRPARFLKPGHAAISRGSSTLGVSFDPIYAANRLRMMNGQAPSGASGNGYAYIWIPMINMDQLDTDGIVTTRDMDWPDTEEGRGHSMIDPPSSVLALGFDDIKNTQVGCKLPDGDFRRVIEVSA